MDKHPISELMATTMQKIREMVDVNTVVGTPVAVGNDTTIVPVTKVSFGFASGGSDFSGKSAKPEDSNLFGGGSGAGVKISPMAFLVISPSGIKVLPVNPPAGSTVDRVVEMVPEVIDKVEKLINKSKEKSDIVD